MDRRSFAKSTILGSLAVNFPLSVADKTRIISLSFDDGFKKSFYKIAEIHETHGLLGCFNVIASGHLPEFEKVDQWILPELMGDFEDWNALKKRGHEIMPHSWKHLNLVNIPLDKAKNYIDKCLIYFEDHLEGYRASEAVFNFPFNSSTEELESYLLSKVRAVRTRAKAEFNSIPKTSDPVRLGCHSNGPNNIDAWVDQKIDEFLAGSDGWLILNLHGLDDEGWGPISTQFLSDLLERLVKIDSLEVLPVGEVLNRTA